MTSFVFDTGALSLFYADDERLRPLIDKIHGGGARGLLSSVKLCEFYYKTCQSLGRDVATLCSRQLGERMQVVGAVLDLSLSAWMVKCRNNIISLTDSIEFALSMRI